MQEITPENGTDDPPIMSEESWEQLDSYLQKLPNPINLVIWGDNHSCQPDSTASLLRALVGRYEILRFEQRRAQDNNPYHPVTGFFGFDENGDAVDFGIRLLGHPAYVQINTLVAAIQATSFNGMTTEAVTRIHLRQLENSGKPVSIDLFTSPEDEGGVVMASLLCSLTVLSPNMTLRITMVNDFPNLISKYSVYGLPHTVINDRHHLQGVYDEDNFLKQLSRALN